MLDVVPSENRVLQLRSLSIAVFQYTAIHAPRVQGSPYRQGAKSTKLINVITPRSISQ